jgi:hypothetical protein
MTRHYDITFEAKTKGALGVSEKFSETVFAESVSAAIDGLYTDYDHVRPLEVYCHDAGIYRLLATQSEIDLLMASGL